MRLRSAHRLQVYTMKWPNGRNNRIRKRAIDLAVGLCALLLTEAGRSFYRPFIYARGIDDFHIADTLGNSLGTVTTIFVMLALFGRDRKFDDGIMLSVTVGLVLYEAAQPLMGNPIDPWDVLATILAGGLCAALYRVLHREQAGSNGKAFFRDEDLHYRGGN
jgi:hypothetical protein